MTTPMIEWTVPEGLNDLVDFAFRPICLVCREPIERGMRGHGRRPSRLLCPHCAAEVKEIPEPTCARCGSRLAGHEKNACRMCERLPNDFGGMRSATMMSGTGETIVYLFKYRGWRDLSNFMVMRILASRWSDRDFWNADLLVPVPISRVRMRERGYNQSGLLAEGISERVGIPIGEGILERNQWRRPQVGLSYRERLRNVMNAFTVPTHAGPRVSSRRIILVDDVITTGATVRACCRALARMGAQRVSCVSFGRADFGRVD